MTASCLAWAALQLCLCCVSAHWKYSYADPADTFNYLTTADWGDDSVGQHACARGMGAVAEEINARQVFMLGDNFYPSGIHPADGPDGVSRITKTFENTYTAASLQNIPFWVVAGNHDWLGNASAQISYSRNRGWSGPISPSPSIHNKTRFIFPYWYHNVTQHIQLKNKTIELEVLLYDTVIAVGQDYSNAAASETADSVRSNPPGDPLPGWGKVAEEQMEWLEGRMANSTADYLWVGGHYPVWAIGHDPPTGIREKLRPLLNKWEAQYFNGHEHDLEHIVENNTKVNYICTGAGKECCYKDTNVDTVPIGTVKFSMSGKGGEEWQPMPFTMQSGFTSYRIGEDSMQVYYHAHNGTIVYVTEPILPRTKKAQPPIGPPGPFYPPPPPKAEL